MKSDWVLRCVFFIQFYEWNLDKLAIRKQFYQNKREGRYYIMEPNLGRETETYLSKKMLCPEHQCKYVFKCSYSICDYPYICSHPSCLGKHFHQQDKIIMTKFQADELSAMLYEVQNFMQDDPIVENARTVKNYIDGLKESIKTIYNGIKAFNQNYDFIKGNSESLLSENFIDRVMQTSKKYKNIKSEFQGLKEKIKLEFPMKDTLFLMRGSLGEFLLQNIYEFSWNKCQELVNSQSQLKSCETFHQELEGKSNLIFIFVGTNMVIGAYFPGAYPSLAEGKKKDFRSFIFINSDSLVRFIRYDANSMADHHIEISRDQYMGGESSGIRTVSTKLNEIEYNLPCANHIGKEVEMNGKMKIEKFMVLRLQVD